MLRTHCDSLRGQGGNLETDPGTRGEDKGEEEECAQTNPEREDEATEGVFDQESLGVQNSSRPDGSQGIWLIATRVAGGEEAGWCHGVETFEYLNYQNFCG